MRIDWRRVGYVPSQFGLLIPSNALLFRDGRFYTPWIRIHVYIKTGDNQEFQILRYIETVEHLKINWDT